MMNLSRNMINNELLQKATMEKIAHLQQEILQSPYETDKPSEALARAYEMLTDEQKIAFILAGGAPSLFYSHQHYIRQMIMGTDTETGQLPVLCL